ncbi:MAG: nucleotide kinase domain-containing protein [Myxococcota bacterium]
MRASASVIHVSRRPPTPSPVYDTYWRFAAYRQEVYFRRLTGEKPPWTDDPVIRAHRFTNAYRASDRVSQHLIREVIQVPGMSVQDVVLRVLLFKVFNRIDTWRTIEAAVGTVSTTSFDTAVLDRALNLAMDSGGRVYSAAYIMPVAAAYAGGRKHSSHLRLLAAMLANDLPERIADAGRLSDVYKLLLGYSGIGPFLAFQYAIDLNYTDVVRFDEMDFVVPGPGCLSGLRKCFSDRGDYTDEELIRWVTDRQEAEFDARSITFRTLFGRRLHLIDCQNLFCEVDKYARVAHPEAGGLAGRTRIKQKYTPLGALPTPVFPAKWGINGQVDTVLGGRA